jgi:hypothetical protein
MTDFANTLMNLSRLDLRREAMDLGNLGHGPMLHRDLDMASFTMQHSRHYALTMDLMMFTEAELPFDIETSQTRIDVSNTPLPEKFCSFEFRGPNSEELRNTMVCLVEGDDKDAIFAFLVIIEDGVPFVMNAMTYHRELHADGSWVEANPTGIENMKRSKPGNPDYDDAGSGFQTLYTLSTAAMQSLWLLAAENSPVVATEAPMFPRNAMRRMEREKSTLGFKSGVPRTITTIDLGPEARAHNVAIVLGELINDDANDDGHWAQGKIVRGENGGFTWVHPYVATELVAAA